MKVYIHSTDRKSHDRIIDLELDMLNYIKNKNEEFRLKQKRNNDEKETRLQYLETLRLTKKKNLLQLLSDPILNNFKAFFSTSCLIEYIFSSVSNYNPQKEKSFNDVMKLAEKNYNNENKDLLKFFNNLKLLISEYDGIIIEMRILRGDLSYIPESEINAVNIIYNYFINKKENQ